MVCLGLDMDFELGTVNSLRPRKQSGVSRRVWYTFHGRVPGRKHMGPTGPCYL